MIVLDDFLPTTYPELKKHSLTCNFKDEINPTDGVTYPLICTDIPEPVINELEWLLGAIIHRKPKDMFTFMRMSPKGVPCPHINHSDNSMAAYSMMLYLEDREDAGTAMVRHKETELVRPEDEHLEQLIKECNDNDKWEVYDMCSMRENRACIFDSSLLHRAMPVGGYGETQKDARTVLTCFFS